MINIYSQQLPDSIFSIQSAEVKWVSQYPALQDRNKKKQNKRSLVSIIIGENKSEEITLSKPVNIFSHSPQDIWVIDQGNESLMRIRNEKEDVPKVFTRQKMVFQSLVGICSVPGGGILFTDSRLNKIYRFKEDQRKIEIFSDSVFLNQPTGIAFNSIRSEVWVVETAAHCITILDEKGNKVKSFGNRGSGKGEFNYPTSIWIDARGFAYVIDALNYRVQIFDANGSFVTAFGEQGNATGYFGLPKGIATDSFGNIYVSDALFNVVQIFDIRGRFLESFGTQGREPGHFWMPAGIFIDQEDTIYVADCYNSRIQLFKLFNIVKVNDAGQE